MYPYTYILFFLLALAAIAFSQETPQRTSVSGTIVDAETGETLPFVQVYFLQSTTNKGMVASGVGTTTDLDGHFSISNTAGYTMVNFQMVGYKTETITINKGTNRTDVKIKLEPDVYGLQDIIVRPKNKRKDYRRRGNPAVDLIKNVIANTKANKKHKVVFIFFITYLLGIYCQCSGTVNAHEIGVFLNATFLFKPFVTDSAIVVLLYCSNFSICFSTSA